MIFSATIAVRSSALSLSCGASHAIRKAARIASATSGRKFHSSEKSDIGAACGLVLWSIIQAVLLIGRIRWATLRKYFPVVFGQLAPAKQNPRLPGSAQKFRGAAVCHSC